MKNKKMIIGVLCIALVFMGIGFALFSTSLNLNGTATSSGTFDVKITNVVLDTTKKTEGATDTTAAITNNYAVTEQNLSATFSEPGDYITWTLTVTNRGSISATFTVEAEPQTATNGAYGLVCDSEEGTVLAPSATTAFQCEMSFDKNHDLTSEQFAQIPKGTNVTMTVHVTAVQSSEYEAPAVPEAQHFIVDSNGYLLGCLDDDVNLIIPATAPVYEATQEDMFYMNTCKSVAKGYYSMNSQEAEAMCENLEDAYEASTLGQGGLPSESDLRSMYVIAPVYEETGETVNVVRIIAGAFQYRGLESVDFSNAIYLEEIGQRAFSNNSLQSLSLPNSITRIDSHAFEDNNITGELILPSSLVRIGSYAFNGNSISGTLTIPNSVEEIINYTFASNKIEELNIGSGLTEIGDGAFQDNQNNNVPTLTTVNISMSASDWNNVQKGTDIFSPASPTFTCNQSSCS